MKAVVMAGGEGTRLRPLTANHPKPLLPVVIRMLRRHGLTETVVTLQLLAARVRNYFGDWAELGMALAYPTEREPLGTAGSVKNAQDALRGEPFLVISGDALTDADLTALLRFHRERGATVTVALKRVEDPGRLWHRDTRRRRPNPAVPGEINLGSGVLRHREHRDLVMQPEVLHLIPPDQPVDWAADVFPALLEQEAPVFGWLLDGYWTATGRTSAATTPTCGRRRTC